jgi:hypothetical protein
MQSVAITTNVVSSNHASVTFIGGENHWQASSQWQALLYTVVSSKPLLLLEFKEGWHVLLIKKQNLCNQIPAFFNETDVALTWKTLVLVHYWLTFSMFFIYTEVIKWRFIYG